MLRKREVARRQPWPRPREGLHLDMHAIAHGALPIVKREGP